jgi:hypothetical protein
MSAPSLTIRRAKYGRTVQIVSLAAAGVLVLAPLAQDLIAYLLMAIPALFKVFLWLRAGAVGVPVLPALSGLVFVYYAMPLLRSDIYTGRIVGAFGSDELVWAGVSVGTFLGAASAAAWPFISRARQHSNAASQNLIADVQIARLIFGGLSCGIIYYLALLSGNLDELGGYLGLIRAILLTVTIVSCYLLGYARARRLLIGGRWALAVAGLVTLFLLASSNLLLVGGVMSVLAAVFGYVVTAKRVPWIGLGVAFAILSILQAGKAEMRTRYWLAHSQSLQERSVLQIPVMMVDWFTSGIAALLSVEKTGAAADVFERASLLHMVVRVQRATPDFIPYLDGESYALLPAMLVPRFITSDKTISQEGLNLLSIRYGLQSADATTRTTIGWGVIAEAFANFGYLGVVAIGAFFGVLCGTLMRFSAGAPAMSLPMFITIAATIVLFNQEGVFSYLIVTMFQSVASVFLLAVLLKLLKKRRSTSPNRGIMPVRTDTPPAGWQRSPEP